jgi:hypothetical protein
MLIQRFRLLASNLGDAGVRETLEDVRFARDSPLEQRRFELPVPAAYGTFKSACPLCRSPEAATF